MSKLKVAAFSLSLDGFGAGLDQSLDAPLGVGGMSLPQWFFDTATFQKMHGGGDSQGGVNTVDDFKQTIFAPTFKHYPLSDTIVSIEHSSIPKSAFVAGLAPTLHAVLSLDHLRVRMRAKEQWRAAR